jgi:hypothetical protein
MFSYVDSLLRLEHKMADEVGQVRHKQSFLIV